MNIIASLILVSMLLPVTSTVAADEACIEEHTRRSMKAENTRQPKMVERAFTDSTNTQKGNHSAPQKRKSESEESSELECPIDKEILKSHNIKVPSIGALFNTKHRSGFDLKLVRKRHTTLRENDLMRELNSNSDVSVNILNYLNIKKLISSFLVDEEEKISIRKSTLAIHEKKNQVGITDEKKEELQQILNGMEEKYINIMNRQPKGYEKERTEALYKSLNEVGELILKDLQPFGFTQENLKRLKNYAPRKNSN